jgi:hypothetical protein
MAGITAQLDPNAVMNADRNFAIGLDNEHLTVFDLDMEKGLSTQTLDETHLAAQLAVIAQA